MLNDVKRHFQETLGLPEEMLGEFIDSFLLSFGRSAADLEPFAGDAAPDWMEIRRITHTIKGFAQGVGADDLLSLSNALNAAAHAQDAESCRQGARAIRALYAAYEAERGPSA